MENVSFAYVAWALQVIFVITAGVLLLAAYRWTARVSSTLGLVLAAGVLIRTLAGVALFVISYFDLPVLSSLHTGDGFWHLAPDARVYFELAAAAAGGTAIPAGSPSPAFLGALGLWIRLAGDSPATAVLFNVVLYVASYVMLVAAFRPLGQERERRGALITLSALTFSPVLILLGTQSLKDVFSVFLVVLATVALAVILSRPARTLVRPDTVLMVCGVALAVYLMAGVRAYYALFLWAAAAGGLAARVLTMPRRAALQWCPFAGGLLVVLWCAFMWGAGPYYPYYGDLITRTIGVYIPGVTPRAEQVAGLPTFDGEGVDAARSRVDSLRQGFVNSGGATNLSQPASTGAPRWRAVLVGLAALFIPISVLTALSIVDVSGGRGFLLVTDIDTVFISSALLAVAWILLTSRAAIRRNLPILCFALGLGVVTTVLVAYVVTNYGTLFRMRLLATVPLWFLPLALKHAGEVAGAGEAGEGGSSQRRTTREIPAAGMARSTGAA